MDGPAFHLLGETRRMGTPTQTGSGTIRSGARNDFIWMARTSELTTRRREPKKGASFEERDDHEALGRARRGYGTKVCVTADGHGKAFGFALAPGQTHELPLAPVMLDNLPAIPLWVVADKGDTSNAFREQTAHRPYLQMVRLSANTSGQCYPRSLTTQNATVVIEQGVSSVSSMG